MLIIWNSVWTNVESARTFTVTPTFRSFLAEVAISVLSSCYVQMEGTLASHGPVERVILSFQSTFSPQERSWFGNQLKQCKNLGLRVVQEASPG